MGDGATALGGRLIEAPLLGVVSEFDPAWLGDRSATSSGASARWSLVRAVNAQMLGIGRLAYSLGTHRQIPSLLSRLDAAIRRRTSRSRSPRCSPSRSRFPRRRVPGRDLRLRRDARVHARPPVGDRPALPGARPGAAVPGSAEHPGRQGLDPAAGCVRGVRRHGRLGQRARAPRGRPVRRRRVDAGRAGAVRDLPAQPGQVADQALHDPRGGAQGGRTVEYGRILVPVFGGELDDDIVGTAGRLAAEEAEEGEGGAMLEALYVFEMPMSLPIDARVPPDKVDAGARRCRGRRRSARSTRAWRWRPRWCAAARSARRSCPRPSGAGWRRSCWRPSRPAGSAAAPASAARPRGGPLRRRHHPLRGREGPCKVILTAPPADAPAPEPEPAQSAA